MIASETNIGVVDPGIIQFENANEGRSYPFDDNVILTTIDGRTLPENIISDMHAVVPMGVDLFLSSAYISEHMISVCFKSFKEDKFESAVSVIVSTEEFESYMPYRMEKLTGSEDIGGIVTFGNFNFAECSGTYRFKDRTMRVVDSAVSRYVPAKLRTLIDDRTGESIRGDVSIGFSEYVDAEAVDGGIHLSLKPGAAKVLMSSCIKDRPINVCGATPITSINGVKPDSLNRIVLWFH